MNFIKRVGKAFWKFSEELFNPPDEKQSKELEDKIKYLQLEIAKLKSKAQSPEEFHEISKKIQNQFIKYVGSMKFNQALKNKSGKHVCFIGPTSVGKSTLYNVLFGLQLQVGLGSCTKQANVIYSDHGKTFWDAPGINKDFGFYSAKHLAFFNDLDEIYILYDRDIDDVALIIKVFAQMKKKLKFVRTKCDMWDKNHKKTIKAELQNDVQQIRQFYPGCQKVIQVGRDMYEQIFINIFG